MIVFGTRHYGKVDEIDGLGYIKTRFAHIWFLPLLPLGSMFVVSEEGDGVQGLKVGLSGRSVVAAWSRTWVVLTTLGMLGLMGFGVIGLLDTLIDGNGINEDTVSAALMSVGAGGLGFFGLLFNVALWWGIGRFLGRASPARAAQLCEQLGVAPASPAHGSIPDLADYADDDPFIDGARPVG